MPHVFAIIITVVVLLLLLLTDLFSNRVGKRFRNNL